MEIILKDFNFKGKHHDEFRVGITNTTDLDGFPNLKDKIVDYFSECLDIFMNED